MNKTPFSKKNVMYARYEAYVITAIVILLVISNKDISSVGTLLLSLGWTGYKGLQMFYIKMAEREHLEEIRQGRLHSGLDISDIDAEIEELENKNIESEVDYYG